MESDTTEQYRIAYKIYIYIYNEYLYHMTSFSIAINNVPLLQIAKLFTL
jgi:hypothetical protein